MKKQTLLLCVLFTLPRVYAALPNNNIQPEAPTPQINPQKPTPPAPAPQPSALQQQIAAMAKSLQNITSDDLKTHPQLTTNALNLAMLNHNWPAVAKILPIYRSQTGADPLLVDYAQGALYREDGEFKKAINLYRKLIAENPNMTRVRMDLAILLFADKQDIAAKDQFIKLRSDPQSDDFIKKIIDQYLEAINKRSAWSFDAGMSYLRDNNVNNASKSKIIRVGNLEFRKRRESLPQKGHGFDFDLGTSKDFNLTGSHYLAVSASTNGKIYWDNHDFDDVTVRLSSGYKYKDAKNNLALQPFAKWRIVAGKAYSKTLGFSVSASRWINPSWQLSTYNELAFEKSTQKDHPPKPSEKQLYASVNAVWARNATQYFVFGANVFDINTHYKPSANTRTGVNLSWNQDWALFGLSSRIGTSFGHKNYHGINYLGVKRKDNDINFNLTLWNRDWHLWGITPKISFAYNRVNSNMPYLYSYDKGTVFFKFDKTF